MKETYFTYNYIESTFYSKFIYQKNKGIDKISPAKFENNFEHETSIILQKINSNKYKFSPYLETLRLKGRNKLPRLISIPTVRDRIVLHLLKEILHNAFSEELKKQQLNQFIHKIKKSINTETVQFYYKTDLSKFYDSINRKKLMTFLNDRIKDNQILSLIEQAIDNPTVPSNYRAKNRNKYQNKLGVPQGLSISNILAQVYLTSFDMEMQNIHLNYFRYVDDILILTDKKINIWHKLSLKYKLRKIGLKLNPAKTESGKLSAKTNYLGYLISNSNISVSKRNIERLIMRIAGKFTWHKERYTNKSLRPKWIAQNDSRFNDVFIEELNELITGAKKGNKRYGWLYYFSELDNVSILFKIDNIIKEFADSNQYLSGGEKSRIKRLVRAYFEIKHKGGGNYIIDYEKYDTINKMRDFLVFRGRINPNRNYTDNEIKQMFNDYQKRRFRKLRKDVDYNY